MKYRHHGYQDDDYRREREQRDQRENRPRRGPRDVSTREATVVMRCWQCGTHQDFGTTAPLPVCTNCKADLHCCRNCMHFDPGARFQCRKPVEKAFRDKTVRIDCTLFEARQVLDATGRRASSPAPPKHDGDSSPRVPNDARDAFDNVFNE